MSFRIAQIPAESKLCQVLHIDILERVYPRERVTRLLSDCHAWETRERKLNHLVIVYYVIALSLWRRSNTRAVYRQLVSALLWVHEQLRLALPTAAALLYRRRQVGIAVFRHLFRQCCGLLATPETPGAFCFGYRVMALDSTLDDVPDSPANALHFGRLHEGPSRSPFPQVRCLLLAEVGTHAIIDAILAPCQRSEQSLARSIMRALTSEMLLLCDRNFPSAAFVGEVRDRHAQVIARLPQDWYTHAEQVLSDGSYLVTLHPDGRDPVTVRIIEYRLHPDLTQELAQQPHSRNSSPVDPTQTHRLLTTLLNAEQAPLAEVIACYHERWDIELCIDEIKVHQHLSEQPLRSKDPQLVYQELYGVLLAHYAVRVWMYESAAQAHLDPDRLSFTHAVQTLQQSTPFFTVLPPQDVAPMQQHILRDLREPASLLPPRRLRFYPRVLKRAFPPFPRKQLWHQGIHFTPTTFQQLLI